MSILVNTHTEQEEKVLIAFLESLQYEYKSNIPGEDQNFLDEYNKEIDEAEAQIESGDFMTHDYVEKLFADRRKNLNENKME